MRRMLFAVMLSIATVVVSAQNATDTYRSLVCDMDKAAVRRDSLATVISALRERYASNELEREALGDRIVTLEQEMYAAKLQYDKAVAAVTDYEQRNANAQNSTTEPVGAKGVAVQTMSAPHKQIANLIDNDFFVRNLSSDDYKMLCTAQLAERSVQKSVGKYLTMHKTMSALQSEYMAVGTEQAADSLMMCYERMRSESDAEESNIEREWAPVYDNKLYCYNLLMEKSGYDDMLVYAEQCAERTAENIARDAETYSSYALVRYYHQKRGLLAYETKIAETLHLSKAKDSLLTISAKLNQADFLLPKISLQKRYFIEYEPLKIVRPSLYNARNPIPRTKIYEHGTIYRIRIGIFRMTPNVSVWRGVTPISYSDAYNKGLKAYFAGGFRTEQEANEGVKYLKRLGFRDPAVVMWVDGEYVTDLDKWAATHAGKYNIEIAGATTSPERIRSVVLARKSDCVFSKAGNVFIVGLFESKSAAEDVAAEISTTDSRLTVKIVKCE